MERKIEAILFDLGETLLNFGDVDLEECFAQGAELAYAYLKGRGKTLPELKKYRRRHLLGIRWNVVKSFFMRREFHSRDLMDRLSRRMGIDLSPEELDELCWLWYEPLQREAQMEEGLPALLDDLRGAGLKLAIVSNTFVPGETLDRHLEKVGLKEYFPVRVYSCDVGVRKPRPRIFRVALENLDVGPERAMFVGDSPRADVRGATHMGMTAVLKDPGASQRRCKPAPTYRIRELGELRGILLGRGSD